MSIKGLIARGVPPMPKWLLWVKVVILVLSLIVLALAAVAISSYGGGSYYYYSGSGAPGMLIFVAIWTFLTIGGAIAVEIYLPRFYWRIAFLVGYAIGIIFWLAGWAWAASVASTLLGVGSVYRGSRIYQDEGNYFSKAGGAMAGAAALGAAVWIMFIVNTVYLVMASLRHPEGDSVQNTNEAELGHVGGGPKAHEGQPPVPVVPQQQPSPYSGS